MIITECSGKVDGVKGLSDFFDVLDSGGSGGKATEQPTVLCNLVNHRRGAGGGHLCSLTVTFDL